MRFESAFKAEKALLVFSTLRYNAVNNTTVLVKTLLFYLLSSNEIGHVGTPCYLLAGDGIERRDSTDSSSNESEDSTTSNDRVEQVLEGGGDSSLSNQGVGHHGGNTDGNTSNESLTLVLGAAIA